MAHRTKKSGAILIEGIIATVVVAIAVMGVINLFVAAYNMSLKTTDKSFAYQVARDVLEQQKSKGFYFPNSNINPPGPPVDATTTSWYASDGSGPFNSLGSNRYKVVLVVLSDKFSTTNAGTQVAEDALRSVKVTVTNLETNTVVFTSGTQLVRGGI